MTSNYDRIARFYDLDMARNMAFDDVAFYLARCNERSGRILELGCGNGRILLPLLAAGRTAIGVDASAGMLGELRRKARAAGWQDPPLCRMDVRALGFRPGFATVLCPYSLVTYLVEPDDFARLAQGVRALLARDGRLIVDAFVPRPVRTQSDFTLDYRRAHEGGELARWKRITALSPGRNRIERRYLDYDSAGKLRETIEVAEVIRAYTHDELVAALAASGFAVEATWWDYGQSNAAGAPQFVTLSARATG